MATKQELNTIQETRDKVNEVLVCLKGLSPTGDDGLIRAVQEIKESVKEQNGKVNRLSKKVWILWGIVVPSAGATVYGIIDIFHGG